MISTYTPSYRLDCRKPQAVLNGWFVHFTLAQEQAMDPVNLMRLLLPLVLSVNEIIRSHSGDLYDVSTLAAELTTNDAENDDVALLDPTTLHSFLTTTCLQLGTPRTTPLCWTCRKRQGSWILRALLRRTSRGRN